MTLTLMLILSAICVWQILYSLKLKDGVLQYPFFLSWVFLIWILPQAYEVSKHYEVPEEAVTRTFLMSIICLSCGIVGFYSVSNRSFTPIKLIDYHKLKTFAIVSILFGAVFHMLLRTVSDDELASSQWSGRTVAFLFLSQPMFYGGVLAISLYLRRKDHTLLLFGIIALLVVLTQILIGGRRGPLVQFALATACILYFVKGYLVPKTICLVLIPLGSIFVNGIAIYRSTVYEGQAYGTFLNATEVIPRMGKGLNAVFEKCDTLLIPQDHFEVLNATMLMQHIAQTDVLDFGSDIWDHLVHTFFPGQLFGRELKASLQFNWIKKVSSGRHRVSSGSTITGLVDAYQSFRWLGGIKFFVIGAIMGYLWNGAIRGDLLAQLAYGCMLRAGLEAVTHSTPLFFMSLINFAIMSGAVIYVLSKSFEKKQRWQLISRKLLTNEQFPQRVSSYKLRTHVHVSDSTR
jgi:hypothetical protein